MLTRQFGPPPSFILFNWHYSQADWDRARERIETFDWDAGMVEDINLFWSQWHTNFVSIMEECIPKKILTSQKNLPCMVM